LGFEGYITWKLIVAMWRQDKTETIGFLAKWLLWLLDKVLPMPIK